MNDDILRSLLEESFEREWAAYANAPEFKASKKHDRAMNRIFKRYERKTRKLYSRSTASIGNIPKRIMIVVLVIILAVLAGCSAVHFISQSFHLEFYSDHTELFTVYNEKCPMTIEKEYYLSGLPEGFEIYDTESTPFFRYISYENKQTNQIISIVQYVKGVYNIHFNTEKNDFTEVGVNGNYGLFLDVSDEENISSGVIWDNKDYILQVCGNFPKEKVLDLAKSAKVL